jgi:hypothetical protein
MVPTSKKRSKGIWLVLVSILAGAAPFYLNLWIYGFIFVTPIHAVVILVSLISLCLKGVVSHLFLWLALFLSSSYFLALFYAFKNFNYGPGP